MLNRILNTGLRSLWVAVLVIVIDRIVKIWSIDSLNLFEPLEILPIFNLTLAYNTGAAFSFLHTASGWQNFVLGGLAVLVSVGVIIWLSKIPAREKLASIALSLIIGGALGNALDRVLYGYVIDLFDFHIGSWHFAIFNVADSAICIGGFLLVLHWFLESKKVKHA